MVDYATGTMGAFAISAALFQRMRTGQGQYVGEHTDEVLALVGYSAEELAALRRSGAIA